MEITLLAFLILAVLFFGTWWMNYLHLKSELRLEGSQLRKMRWRPWDWNANRQEGARVYYVEYIDSAGHKRTRQCRISKERGGILWIDQKDIF
jgi:hypothetical protein